MICICFAALRVSRAYLQRLSSSKTMRLIPLFFQLVQQPCKRRFFDAQLARQLFLHQAFGMSVQLNNYLSQREV